MKKNLSQSSTIGKALCIVGLIAIIIGTINFLVGCVDLAGIGHYHKEIETMTASLRVIGSIGSGVAGLLFLGFSEVIRHLSDISAATSVPDKENSTPRLPSL